MVTNPSDYVEPLGKAGASGFTFHIEVTRDNWQELIQSIKSKGMRPGVSLRPGTPVEEVFPLVEAENPVELVLVMTVEPGFGGQKFMPEMMDKVRTLRNKYPSLDIEVLQPSMWPHLLALIALWLEAPYLALLTLERLYRCLGRVSRALRTKTDL